MGKRKKTRGSKLTKKQVARRRREQRQLTWIWASVGGVVVLVVLVLVAGLVSQNTRAVAVVNGQPIRVPEYQKRVRFWYH